MLDDRDYMRQPVYRDRPRMPPMSFTIALLIVNAIVFLIECAVYRLSAAVSADSYFALSVEGLKHGYVWQLLTYQFMHAGVLHILLNGWAIYVFGHAIEQTLGWKKFLTLFLASGVIGGLFQSLAALLWPEYFGGPGRRRVGGRIWSGRGLCRFVPGTRVDAAAVFHHTGPADRKNAVDFFSGAGGDSALSFPSTTSPTPRTWAGC